MHRLTICTLLGAVCLMGVTLHSDAAGDPSTKPSKTDAERAKWESNIELFGDEATGEWSLRIKEANIDAKHLFRLRELWTYNPQSKRWERTGTDVISTWMLPPGQKKPDPGEQPDPDDTQILAELPIDKDQVGLFYFKWSVDDVRGASFRRIGTGLDKKSDYVHKPPPEGKIWVVLPVDKNHSVPTYIPNPQLVCKSAGD